MSVLIRTICVDRIGCGLGGAGPCRRRRLRCDERHRRRRAGLFRLRARHRGSPVSDAQVILRPKKGEPVTLKTNVLGLYRSHSTRRSRRRTSKSPAARPATSSPACCAAPGPTRTCSSRPTARCSGCRISVPPHVSRTSAPQASFARVFDAPCRTTVRDPDVLLVRLLLCLSACVGPRPVRRHRPPQRQDRRNDGTAPAQALAVRDGKIAAVGTTADIRALAGPNTRVIDLDGRTVIPGLIDSHIHAIRAGLTFTTEVHWIGVRTLADALDRIRAAAEKRAEGDVADRRRRLDRAAVRRRPPPDAG